MAVKFQTGEAVTVIFPFGDFREIHGQHGLQYLYTVQLNGDPREKLYATPTLHRELQAAGVAAGTLFTITKLGGENGQYWSVADHHAPAAGNGHPPAGPAPGTGGQTPQRAGHDTHHAAPGAPPASPAIQSPLPARPAKSTGRALPPPIAPDDFTRMEHLLGHCLAASARVCSCLKDQAPFTSEDIRRLGVELFHECTRNGVLPEPLQR